MFLLLRMGGANMCPSWTAAACSAPIATPTVARSTATPSSIPATVVPGVVRGTAVPLVQGTQGYWG